MTDSPFDTDVLIVGAGPTGLTLACELARRGVDYRIVDRFDAPSPASRGKGIQPRSLEVFDDLGMVNEILSTSTTKLPVRIYDGNGEWTDQPPLTTAATVATPYPEMVWIGEFDVERALRERLAQDGGQVVFGTRVTGLTQVDGGVEVNIGDEIVRARWVVGADGGRSTIRKGLDMPFEGVTDTSAFYLGDVRTLDLDRGRLHMWASADGMLALTPLPGSDLWQFQLGLPDSDDEPAPASLELYQRMIDERAGAGRVTFTDASWLSLYQANIRLARHYRVGNVLLAGDAAHAHTPAGGQGMNTGVQDAYNLGWKLAAVLRGADPMLLDTYETERKPIAASVLADSTAKHDRVHSDIGGSADELSAVVHTLGDDHTSGLAFSYPPSELVHEDAGQRAPYVTGLRGPGFSGTTMDLLRGPHWTALAFTDDADAGLDVFTHQEIQLHRIGEGAIIDPQGAAKSAFGVPNDTLVLIRPDGYIARTMPLKEAAVLPESLAALLPSA